MKKTLAAVLAAGALFIGGISSVDAANWYTVGTDSNGITWSIDNDSVKKDDKKAVFGHQSYGLRRLPLHRN